MCVFLKGQLKTGLFLFNLLQNIHTTLNFLCWKKFLLHIFCGIDFSPFLKDICQHWSHYNMHLLHKQSGNKHSAFLFGFTLYKWFAIGLYGENCGSYFPFIYLLKCTCLGNVNFVISTWLFKEIKHRVNLMKIHAKHLAPCYLNWIKRCQLYPGVCWNVNLIITHFTMH